MNQQCIGCTLLRNTVNGAWCLENRISVEYSKDKIDCSMDAKDFFMAVREMRRLQKEYFKNRDQNILKASCSQEKVIDTEIARVEAILGERLSEADTRTLNEKISDGILELFKKYSVEPQEGLEELSTAYLSIILAIGAEIGYGNPKAFAQDLIEQLMQQL